MWKSIDWKDYELLDTSDGERLERWGNVILVRPDPQVIWHGRKEHPLWKNYSARYHRSSKGGGSWEFKNIKQNLLDEGWDISYKSLKFRVRPTGFKHTGVFPEQAVNWDFAMDKIRNAKESGKDISVLNLFAYTGGATLACASAGASVCHVDASKGMVAWAKETAAASGLKEAPIRYIVDDCKKFLEREIRRGHKYDVLIMDPPSYGRGPSGELWRLEDDVDSLIGLCSQVISDDPLFVLVNSYTTGLSASTVGYLLELHFASRFGGKVFAEEIGIPVTTTGGTLPSGASARWIKE
ncbi:MAG: class I SAM-dependent methyltransferase [Clostridia bacterium]|nr:class I SAM-dependent methyltransferase [Clostridia bacterium]